MAAPALVVRGQQNREAMPQAGLVRLLDEDARTQTLSNRTRYGIVRLIPKCPYRHYGARG